MPTTTGTADDHQDDFAAGGRRTQKTLSGRDKKAMESMTISTGVFRNAGKRVLFPYLPMKGLFSGLHIKRGK